ncbi:MAG: alginate export family protein [Acidobacteriota bacterium]
MKKIFLLFVLVAVGFAFALPALAQQKQGDKNFEVTGEVRFRGDYTDNVTDFNDAADDAGIIWPWRVRAGIHGNFSRNVSAHVEFQNFGFSGDGDNGIFGFETSAGNTDLYQGWVELGNIGGSSFDLRLGRQELVFGSEMLLGDLDFYNGIVHDGLRASWQYRGWTLDTWYTKIDESADLLGPASFRQFPDDQPSDDIDFYGGYATFKNIEWVGFDAYAMVLKDGEIVSEERITVGGRVYNKNDSNWDWFAEAAFQTGEFDDGVTTTDISAFGFEGELGYQFSGAGVKPRVYGRFSSYSGEDGDPDESEAFDPLFQDFHPRLGYMDLFVASNLDVIQGGVSWSGSEDRHIFGADLLKFTLNEEIAGEDDLGTEIDLYYKFAYTKNVHIEAAIANFSPGDLFPAGVDDNALRVYGNTRLRW